jgi:catalase
MWTWLLDDIGIPRDYRHMDGFGVHTFKWINRTGHFVFVKYHWKSEQGISFFLTQSFCSLSCSFYFSFSFTLFLHFFEVFE